MKKASGRYKVGARIGTNHNEGRLSATEARKLRRDLEEARAEAARLKQRRESQAQASNSDEVARLREELADERRLRLIAEGTVAGDSVNRSPDLPRNMS